MPELARTPLLGTWVNRGKRKGRGCYYAPTRVMRLMQDQPISQRKLRLSQPQHDPQQQEGKEHLLCRVENDGHPRAPVAVGGEGVQESGKNRIRYNPGQVNVIKTEE